MKTLKSTVVLAVVLLCIGSIAKPARQIKAARNDPVCSALSSPSLFHRPPTLSALKRSPEEPASLIPSTDKQTPANMTDIICKPPTYGWSPTRSLLEGVSYLKAKKGSSEFGWQEGGKYCTRVSCEYDSGIYVCNDNEFSIKVPYEIMATYAQYVIDYTDAGDQTACTWLEKNVENSGDDLQVAWGQVFDINGFNVVVGMKEWTSC